MVEAGVAGFAAGATAAGGATETGGLVGAETDGAAAAGAGAEGAGLVRAALAADCAVDSSSEAPLIFARTFTATSSGMELE